MWSNKNYVGMRFLGNYELQKNGQVKFHLIHVPEKGKALTLKFRSWQAAVKQGWSKK